MGELVRRALPSPEGAEHAAKRIAEALGQRFEHEWRKIALSCSIGISLFPADATEAAGLIKCADHAMYDAKKAGRNAFCFYSRATSERLRLVSSSDGQRQE